MVHQPVTGGAGMPASVKKKLRKAYTITRARERWTAEEHDRFLHALLLFGRDWKKIEGFVGTKTTIQIRSHAQKHFLKAQKFGLTAGLPPPHPRRAAFLQLPPVHPDNGGAMDWAACCSTSPEISCWPNLESQGHLHAPTAPSSTGAWLTDASQDETVQLPLSPDDLRFAQVYRFVGDVFGSDEPRPVEAHLMRLQAMDPVVVETIFMVLRNLEENLLSA